MILWVDAQLSPALAHGLLNSLGLRCIRSAGSATAMRRIGRFLTLPGPLAR